MAPVLHELKVSTLARLFFLHFPPAKQLSEALAWQFTCCVPHASGQPLLKLAMRNAFDVMLQTQASLPESERVGREVLIAYLAGLFQIVPAIVEVKVATGREEWDPLSAPFPEWTKPRLPVNVDLHEELPDAAMRFTPPQLRLSLLNRLATPPVWQALQPHLRDITAPAY